MMLVLSIPIWASEQAVSISRVEAVFQEAGTYSITTVCDPVNGGSITLGDGVVDGTSQEGETVHFHVGTQWGYRIMQVIVTDETDATIEVNTENTAADGNDYSFVMPGSNVTVTAQFYESEPDLYLLGTAMGRTSWVAAGPKFDYDPVNQEYYLDVYFKGGNDDTTADQAYGYFSLAKQIDGSIDWTTAASGAGNWSLTQGNNRLAAQFNNFPVQDGSTNVPLYAGSNNENNAFKIPAGVYRITVNKAMTSMSIEQTPLSLSFDPASGSAVALGTIVHVSNTVQDVVHGIADEYGINEDDAQTKSRNDGSNNWYVGPNGGTNVTLNRLGQITVDSEAWIGYIKATGSAVYTVLGTYRVTTVCTPAAGGSINLDLDGGNTVTEGETLTFTVTTNSPYILTDVVLTYVDADNVTQTVMLTPDGYGIYSFVMPGSNVTITANYDTPPSHHISTVVIPTRAGTIDVKDSEIEGETVVFTIRDNNYDMAFDDYSRYSLTVTTDNTQETITLTEIDSHTYSFVMPADDVTINLEYRKWSMVRASWTPEDGGVVGIGPENRTIDYVREYETVTFQAVPNPHFAIGQISTTSATYVDNGDGTYSFVMPHVGVNIHVNFIPVGEYQVNVVNDPTEAGSTTLSGHVKSKDGNYYSDETMTVVVTPKPKTGWAISTVDAVDAQNDPVAVTDNGDGSYSLVMPASDVTITAHYERVPYTITTDVSPNGGGVITLMGDAADNDEVANQTVTFSVEPNYGYSISSVYYKYVYSSAPRPVTDNGDGTYSFVMPEANVIIVVRFSRTEYTFRRVKNHRDVIEGGTYIYMDRHDHVYLGRNDINDPTVLGPIYLPSEKVLNGGERVIVNSNAAMFKIVNLVDTTYDPLSYDYGLPGEVPYKAAFLKMVDDGSYIGLPNNPVYPFTPELFNVDNPNEKFENLRVILRVEDRTGFWRLDLYNKESAWSYYPHVWPHPLTNRRVDPEDSTGTITWRLGYCDDHETFYLGQESIVSLYKLPQPFTVTTQCVEPEWGSIELTSVDGNVALDGKIIQVTPVAADGYGLLDLTVTINDTGEVLDVIKNSDGTYFFEMPAADVTVKANFGPGHRLTLAFDPENFEHGGYSALTINGIPNDLSGDDPTHYQVDGVIPNAVVNINISLDDYYTVQSVTVTNDNTGEVSEWPVYGVGMNEDGSGYLYTMSLDMPTHDVTITVNALPGHMVTFVPMLFDSESEGYIESEDGGWALVTRYYFDDNRDDFPYFAENEEVSVDVKLENGYRLDHVTAVCNTTGESFDLTVSHDELIPGVSSNVIYKFSMPDDDVTITAYYVPFTPLAYIEESLKSRFDNDEIVGVLDGDPVTVDDELIGVWAVAQPETEEKLLWAKDQSPYYSYDKVLKPDGAIDYVRQNMKLQKKEWSQSNWVVLDFYNLYELWEGSEEAFIQKMEDLVDHKIKAGTITGTYNCEGDELKAKHKIVLDEWPEAVNPNDVTSLGYPGYAQDPKEEKAYDYNYNHYVPANFMKKYVSGLFGGLVPEEGEELPPGAVAGNPDYSDKRWFFMKPKDAEVAQVWAVWLGKMEFYDEFEDNYLERDVFETYVSDPANGVNLYDFGGAFYVPHWDYNRWTTGDGVDHYGYPEGEVSLAVNTDYLFHIAIETRGILSEEQEPLNAPRRAQSPQARNDEPWTFYSVYPLDLDPKNSTSTALREVNAPASTTIDSIRYYNVMGQEIRAPFDGINIMVIRYKDGSMISKKILR